MGQLLNGFDPIGKIDRNKALNTVHNCTADVLSWMINDMLILNNDNIEFLVIGTSKQLSKRCLSVA